MRATWAETDMRDCSMLSAFERPTQPSSVRSARQERNKQKRRKEEGGRRGRKKKLGIEDVVNTTLSLWN